MTRKDYIFIADIVCSIPQKAIRFDVASQFASKLRADNSRFDEDRFMKACDCLDWLELA